MENFFIKIGLSAAIILIVIIGIAHVINMITSGSIVRQLKKLLMKTQVETTIIKETIKESKDNLIELNDNIDNIINNHNETQEEQLADAGFSEVK